MGEILEFKGKSEVKVTQPLIFDSILGFIGLYNGLEKFTYPELYSSAIVNYHQLTTQGYFNSDYQFLFDLDLYSKFVDTQNQTNSNEREIFLTGDAKSYLDDIIACYDIVDSKQDFENGREIASYYNDEYKYQRHFENAISIMCEDLFRALNNQKPHYYYDFERKIEKLNNPNINPNLKKMLEYREMKFNSAEIDNEFNIRTKITLKK